MRSLALLFLVACKKEPPPPPPSVGVDAAPAPTAKPACDLTVESTTADLVVVEGWREAHRKAAGFEEEVALAEADAKKTLCRMDACEGAPPWYVSARVTPHAFPANLVVPLEGKKLAVVRLGTLGIAFCDEEKKDTKSRLVDERSLMDGIIVYREEITPACVANAPTEHRWHLVDPKTKKERVLHGKDLKVTVHARSVAIESPACHETRSLD